ncbi:MULTISPECIES: hypothetical protein [Fictibacillus]|uniref:Phr family secreted Rap phosphatase inhibitor n=1 Tax=Fictibacillus terranigra TaxID=3058424 RepID=A0ABT8EDW1_9BACL|nr:hypothetical protein [Fictibacillus sp. CENA-BCM004]MDN4076119.1 hypothetical protein [Fictibacillus sp. CENA-BCM004]
MKKLGLSLLLTGVIVAGGASLFHDQNPPGNFQKSAHDQNPASNVQYYAHDQNPASNGMA